MSEVATDAPKPRYVIRPPRSWLPTNLRELWDFRGLLVRFAARDLTLRYRQTFLGMIWVVLQPLFGAGALSFVFGSVAGLKGPKGVPIFVLSFAGMTAWNLFGTLTSRASGSLLGNSAMIQKVFFPRLLLPLSSLLSTLVDLCVSMVVLVVPLVSPVGFTLADAPHGLRWLVVANPLTGLLEAVRWSTIGTAFPPGGILAYSVGGTFAIFVFGILVFTRLERQFADVI